MISGDDSGAPDPPRSRSPAARVLGIGARGAERLAGATGVDQAVEDAMEEAIVRALRSPAVERAIVRLIEQNAVQDAISDALASDDVADAVIAALETEVADRVWADLLASDKAQMLVERIAEAPEVRAAIAQQGVGLVTDIGRRLTTITERLDDAAERAVHFATRSTEHEGETNQAGLATRALAGAVDIALLAGLFSIVSGLIASVFGSGDGFSLSEALTAAGLWFVVGGSIFVAFWSLVGQTPGMRFLSIRLDVDGSREVGFRRAVRRVLAIPISLFLFGLGFLSILRSPTRQGWHDRFAGTEVVYDHETTVAPHSTLPPRPDTRARP